MVLREPTTIDLPRVFADELETWIGATDAPVAPGDRQHPIDELLAEHDLLRAVLVAMQAEATRLANKQLMRPAFWSDAVDVLGNFGLLCHWRKKANHLFPMLAGTEFKSQVETAERAQAKEIELTLDLADAVQDGDWEKIVRITSILVSLQREHLEREENDLLKPLRDSLTDVQVRALEVAFEQADARSLHEDGRRGYLELTRSLVEATGLIARLPVFAQDARRLAV